MPTNQKARTLWMWPIWFLALFTPAKSFKDNPIIGARSLNWCGLHIIRVILARAVTHFRWWCLTPYMNKAQRRQFHKDGFIVVPNFLAAPQIKTIRTEITQHNGEARCMTQGNTATQRILLDDDALKDKPTLQTFCSSQPLINPLRYSAATLTKPLLYVQRIRNGFRAAPKDPQKNMHADTFHPTMKAWVFLEDVTEEKGPFTYVRGSHRLTSARLAWEYHRSLTAAQNPDGYSEKGSFRADAGDLKAMGLPQPEGICATAGTLVIANTNGFHGRGNAADGQSRLEIWAYSRPNPFNPLPGLPFQFVASLQNRILRAYWRKKDRQASGRGTQASWHLIDAHEMTDFE